MAVDSILARIAAFAPYTNPSQIVIPSPRVSPLRHPMWVSPNSDYIPIAYSDV